MVDVSEKMLEAGLNDLRDRKLLKYLFASEPETCGAYGYVEQPLDLDVQREVVRAIYTAMHSAREVDGETVERVALAMLEASGRNISDPDQRREVAMAYYGYMAKCAIAAMGEGDVR